MDTIVHISEKPWGDYTEADYTLQQWHNACLIHQHTGPPTSKSQCKLPVKTPSGVLNRDGVHAALAALHGARTPLIATAAEKAQAAAALRRYYGQLNEPIPASLAQSSIGENFIKDGYRMKPGTPEELVHAGIKGEMFVKDLLSQKKVGTN